MLSMLCWTVKSVGVRFHIWDCVEMCRYAWECSECIFQWYPWLQVESLLIANYGSHQDVQCFWGIFWYQNVTAMVPQTFEGGVIAREGHFMPSMHQKFNVVDRRNLMVLGSIGCGCKLSDGCECRNERVHTTPAFSFMACMLSSHCIQLNVLVLTRGKFLGTFLVGLVNGDYCRYVASRYEWPWTTFSQTQYRQA